MIEGKIIIKVVHGRDIYPEDGDSVDPYVQINLPNGTTVVKTEFIKKQTDCVWNKINKKP